MPAVEEALSGIIDGVGGRSWWPIVQVDVSGRVIGARIEGSIGDGPRTNHTTDMVVQSITDSTRGLVKLFYTDDGAYLRTVDGPAHKLAVFRFGHHVVRYTGLHWGAMFPDDVFKKDLQQRSVDEAGLDAGERANLVRIADQPALLPGAVPPSVRLMVVVPTLIRQEIEGFPVYSDAVNEVLALVAQTNESFVNSAVDVAIELAGVLYVDFDAGTMTRQLVLAKFRDPADGAMDEVHAFRQLVGADLCVVLSEDIGGIAAWGSYSLASPGPDSGFALVGFKQYRFGCYIFTHELGHLFGCRHNVEADSASVPRPYAHGWCPGFDGSSRVFRTLMSRSAPAYASGVDRWCIRPVWSSVVSHYEGQGLGRTYSDGQSTENDRVVRENADRVANYVSIPESLVVGNGWFDARTAYLRLTAVSDIEIATDYALPPSQSLDIEAGAVIRIRPGFSVERGSELTARIIDASLTEPSTLGDT